MLDVRIASMTQKWMAQYLYIIHRAIALDPDVTRAKAFVKRLLQISLYMPSQAVAGVLIIVSKILLDRPQIGVVVKAPSQEDVIKMEAKEKMLNDDSDDEEYYADVQEGNVSKKKVKKQSTASWCFSKVKKEKEEVKEEKEPPKEEKPHKAPKIAVKYDHFFRNPTGAGAQYEDLLELIRVKEHFHPTVQKFCDAISANKRIDYYGDPLVDFSLTRFLDRFAFKNPKKAADAEREVKSAVQAKHLKTKEYKQHGSRGIPVSALTSRNCTEDERFIFNYLERRRQIFGSRGEKADDSDEDDLDDDEFDAYLDGLGGKQADEKGGVDFMKEIASLPDSGSSEKAPGKKRKKGGDEDDDEDDWNEDADGGEGDDDVSDVSMNGDEDMSDLSDLGEDFDDDDDEGMTDSDEEESGPRSKKEKGVLVSEKEFNRKLKSSADMSSLFAAADDFGELLESTGKIKKHGTTDEVSRKDKASEKQLSWEQNRFKGAGGKSRVMGKATLKNKSKKFKKK